MPEPETIERLTRSAHDAAVRLHVRSALNPILWLCGIVTPAAFVASYLLPNPVQLIAMGIGSLPVLCACGAYIYLMIVDPNRLHSEDYQLRRQALEMIHEKGSKIGVLASSVIAITNPGTHELPGENK